MWRTTINCQCYLPGQWTIWFNGRASFSQRAGREPASWHSDLWMTWEWNQRAFCGDATDIHEEEEKNILCFLMFLDSLKLIVLMWLMKLDKKYWIKLEGMYLEGYSYELRLVNFQVAGRIWQEAQWCCRVPSLDRVVYRTCWSPVKVFVPTETVFSFPLSMLSNVFHHRRLLCQWEEKYLLLNTWNSVWDPLSSESKKVAQLTTSWI